MTDKERTAAIAFLSNLIDHDAEAWGCAQEIPIFKTALEALTSDGWVPCSERLPEENEIVLTTINCGDEGRDIMFASCCENVWQDAYANNLGVLAWRPLPEPWKGEE